MAKRLDRPGDLRCSVVKDCGIITDSPGNFVFLRLKYLRHGGSFCFDRIVNPVDERQSPWCDRITIQEGVLHDTRLGLVVRAMADDRMVDLEAWVNKGTTVLELTDWYRRVLDGRLELFYEDDSPSSTFLPSGEMREVARAPGQSLILGQRRKVAALLTIARVDGDDIHLEIHREDGNTEHAVVAHEGRYNGSDFEATFELDDTDLVWMEFRRPVRSMDLEVYASQLILEQIPE